VKVDRQSDNIASQAFNIFNVVPGKSGKLYLTRAVSLEPSCEVYTPAEWSLRGCSQTEEETQKYKCPGYNLIPIHKRSD
jgi:hypothetical protein